MKIAHKVVAWMVQVTKVLMINQFITNSNNTNHSYQQLVMNKHNSKPQLRLKQLMLHALTQTALASSQQFNKKLKKELLLQKHQYLISQMVDGSVLNAKTTTLKEEIIAIDAKKKDQKRMLKVSQSIWAKLSLLRNKRKLLKLKKMEML